MSFSFLETESSIWILHPAWRKMFGAAFLYDVWCQRELNLTRHSYQFWLQLLAKHSGIRWPKLFQCANIASEDKKPYLAFKIFPETEKSYLFMQVRKSMCCYMSQNSEFSNVVTNVVSMGKLYKKNCTWKTVPLDPCMVLSFMAITYNIKRFSE